MSADGSTQFQRFDDADVELCLTGRKLYGDDFSLDQIADWYHREEQAYFQLVDETPGYVYDYHPLNIRHGFRWLPAQHIGKVLGLGSATADEFEPIVDRIDSITVIEPGAFEISSLKGIPVNRVQPSMDGTIQCPSEGFDLISCIGVLHHIPNISRVVSELYRCLKPGGFALFREPINSMGDWRHPRVGLTPCERGLPIQILDNIFSAAGFKTVRRTKCEFSGFVYLGNKLKINLLRYPAIVAIDSFISSLPIWSTEYHPQNLWQRIRPVSAFYVLQRLV